MPGFARLMGKWIWPWQIAILTVAANGELLSARHSISLDGTWQFQRQGDSEWKNATVPGPWERHEGITFDGRGTYRKTIPTPAFSTDQRILLHFDAIATWAEVRVNGEVMGAHLGGWTPMRFDITKVAARNQGRKLTIEVAVEERVGHNSQGFLPVFAPHFGGIWQSARILIVPRHWVDERYALVVGDCNRQQLRLELPVVGMAAGTIASVDVTVRERNAAGAAPTRAWSTTVDVPVVQIRTTWRESLGRACWLNCSVPIPKPVRWSPRHPQLYEVDVTMRPKPFPGPLDETAQVPVEHLRFVAAFREINTQGDRLLLNGQPLQVRGVLNWGYAPPSHAPSLDESHFREELKLIRSLGFNTMKFCLWVPPRRYLELCDELGVLAWVEYPTWHSQWTPEHHSRLRREFAEFFAFDRNHPSVILRSLTCETGSQADLSVIKSLYDQCHAMIPSAVVEDDSSWIEWNRIHDFYDDHPYGNNDTWTATLERLKRHIAQHGTKPLVLGEAIAADTWVSPHRWESQIGKQPRPFWLPNFLEDNARWLTLARSLDRDFDEKQLAADSMRYAMLMRKFQIEVFRREVPNGGYVVSTLRDIPLCSMGLIDYAGQPKWSPEDWSWHGDEMVLLRTPNDRRSFSSGETLTWDLLWRGCRSSAGEDGEWQVRAELGGQQVPVTVRPFHGSKASNEYAMRCEVALPAVRVPTPLDIDAKFAVEPKQDQVGNRWRLWIMPAVEPLATPLEVDGTVPEPTRKWLAALRRPDTESSPVLVAARVDLPLWRRVQQGAKLLWLVDGERGSLPVERVWFLRGGPWVASHPIWQRFPRAAFVDLQAFDLSSPVVPDIQYLPHVRPMAMLWQNHDLDRVQTQGLMFEARVGKGRMLVTTLPHERSVAGRYLFELLVEHLARSAADTPIWPADMVRQVEQELQERRLDLAQFEWRFREDPENQGLEREWHRRTWEDSSAKRIRIGTAWEGQGHESLDGWAWYSLDVTVPADWTPADGYLVFHGVDDYYDVYVNGKRVGGGGNIERKETAFEERSSHPLGRIHPGSTLRIVIRVYDWYGAGGVFRPVWLSNTPYHPQRILK